MQVLFCMTGLDGVFCPKVTVKGSVSGSSTNLPLIGSKLYFSKGDLAEPNLITADSNGLFSNKYDSVKFNITVKSFKDITIGSFSVSVDGDYSANVSNVSSGVKVNITKDPSVLNLDIKVEEKSFFGFIGTSLADNGLGIAAVSDGGYVLAGRVYNNIPNIGSVMPLVSHSGSSDCLVAKLNSSGSVVWYTILGGAGIDESAKVIESPDGGFILVGNAADITSLGGVAPLQPFSGSSQFDAIVIKLNSSGAVQWFTFLGAGAANRVFGTSVVLAKDKSGYVIGGYAQAAITTLPGTTPIISHSAGSYDQFLLKLKINGSAEWITYFGSTGSDQIDSVAVISDGSYVTVGSSLSVISNVNGITPKIPNSTATNDILVNGYNSSGTLKWYSFFGGTGADGGNFATPASDGGILIGGSIVNYISSLGGVTPVSGHSGTGSCVAIKLNSTGDIEWFTFLGYPGIVTSCNSSVQSSDSGYALSGTSAGNISALDGIAPNYLFYGGALDVFVAKISERGIVNWYDVLGSSGTDTGENIINTPDGGFMGIGSAGADISSIDTKTPLYSYSTLSDIFFFKLKGNGKF